MQHVPCFVEKIEELKGKGIKKIICISVNDSVVMNEWSNIYINKNHIKFLEYGSEKYTYELGLEIYLSKKGLGIRS